MSSATRTSARRAGAAIMLVLAAAVVVWLGTRSPAARAADSGSLAQRISSAQGRVSSLAGAVGADNGRLRVLDAAIAGLERRIARIQSDLDAKRAELLRLRAELDAARLRLASLVARERKDKVVLSNMLVADYETTAPNLVSVVLDSNGFSNLLERLSFARRVTTYDQQVITAMIVVRDRVAAEAVRLGNLEGRQQTVTARVLAERDQLDANKVRLLRAQIAVVHTRDKNLNALANARGQVATLNRQLARLQAEQARQAALAAASQTASGGGGPVYTGGRAGSDPIPGFTIGRDDMGVDATASTGAGIYAPVASTLVQVLQDWYAGEPLLLFQFDNPPAGAPSDYWYVAEQIDPATTAVGTRFQAGQRVASYASSGTGIEIGWGSATSDTRTLAGATDPAAASPPPGSATSWAESFKSAFGIP